MEQVYHQAGIYVTSFSSSPNCSNSEHWSQKQTQSGNIQSIILDVHAGWQSSLNYIFDKSTKSQIESRFLIQQLMVLGTLEAPFFSPFRYINVSSKHLDLIIAISAINNRRRNPIYVTAVYPKHGINPFLSFKILVITLNN